MNPGVEPPSDDEIFDDETNPRDLEVQQSVEQATQYHQMMDQAKDWARTASAELRVEAALEDDPRTADELEEIAELIKTVTTRIERGDNLLARQP